MSTFLKTTTQPENPFTSFVPNQTIAIIPSFTLESGITLLNVPLAYTTRGELSTQRDNAMVICHALTGHADVGDWWGPLIGPGRAFDISKFFVVCMNSLGSPYGSASPVTCKNGDQNCGVYGPEFPLTTIRDDVNFHKMLLDDLGVKQIAAVIGGSLGGMLVLEWAYFGKNYVRCIIPIATSSQYSGWGIGWGEAQRQSIFADPKYNDGYYTFADPPITGLSAARMSALLTYRSRDSFEARFGRKAQNESIKLTTAEELPSHTSSHNSAGKNRESVLSFFSVQSYLRCQGSKFAQRFDANCYIAITRKLDTHDVSRSRKSSILDALALIQQPTLVLGIESDGLFTFSEQAVIASGIPNAKLEKIDSSEGHDAFLLQLEQVNQHILLFLKDVIPDIIGAGKKLKAGSTEEDDITAW